MGYTWVRAVNDQVITSAPACVASVIVTPDASNTQADITLHDGESTQDPQLITIRTLAGDTKVVNFQPYLDTKRGVYLDIGSNVEEVLIQLTWETD